jgi:hypothetical protein
MWTLVFFFLSLGGNPGYKLLRLVSLETNIEENPENDPLENVLRLDYFSSYRIGVLIIISL